LVFNRDSLVSLSSNRFTLPAGTWEISWRAPMAGENETHQSFLYNFTDSTEVARGDSAAWPGDVSGQDVSCSEGHTVVTIAASKAFQIRHHPVSITQTGGRAVNLSTEVYTRVTVRRA
jgi:hypothetical protein